MTTNEESFEMLRTVAMEHANASIRDRLTATIKNRLPRLQDWEIRDLVKDIEGAGLVVSDEWIAMILEQAMKKLPPTDQTKGERG